MPPKVCPLSFFNFYINKEAAQAGGCHLCVEESCAWWDENYQQCSIKSGLDALGVVADLFSNFSNDDNHNEKSPISDIMAKLRLKKKLVETATKEPIIPPPPPPPPPSNQKSVDNKVVTLVGSDSAISVSAPNVETSSSVANDDILSRPKVPISELPVISLNSSSKDDDLKL